MMQERGYSLILDEVSPLTIQRQDKVGDCHPRIFPRPEAVVGIRISIGMHAAAMLLILLLPYFAVFQVGEKPSCVTVSLVSPLKKDSGVENVPADKREATDQIHRQPEHEVIEKPPPVRPDILAKKEKKEISLSAKTKPKTNTHTPSLHQAAPQDEKIIAEPEPATDLNGERGSGSEKNPASSKGRPIHDMSGEFSLQQVDQPPTPTRRIEPEFPLTARRLGIGGKVVVKFLVKTDGNVARASIIEADPKEIFEESALKAVREWQFNPGRLHGEVVATWVVLPIQFRLTR